MKRNPLSGAGKVYGFTLKQMISAKGWIISTILIGALLLIGIPLLLWGISAASTEKEEDDSEKANIKTVLVVDETEGEADYSMLSQFVDPSSKHGKLTYTASSDSAEAALDKIKGSNDTVLLRVTKPDAHYLVTVVVGEESEISRSKASSFASFVQSSFSVITMQKAELTPEGISLLNTPVNSDVVTLSADTDNEDEETSPMEDLFSILIPVLMLMLIYMMVILYGQSVANSVMLEKNSKLIESMLTAVHPVALMTGKLLAGASAAIIQLLIWLGALIGGVFGGAVFALKMVPDTQNSTVNMVNSVIQSDLPISIPGLLVGLLVLSLGFVLYLSLSCLSGALASKQEDLNKTNMVFTLILVVSFFLCMSGGMNNVTEDTSTFLSQAPWLRIFPFTSIMLMPSELLIGKADTGLTIGCIAALILSVALFVALAATVYKMLVFYRGKIPSPKELLAMFRDNKKK
ncbi:MAG: ABC transporter permease [Oscillospiraceae bacterium]|nr:ABC transporter permease [Oscillospiraceae bacterium]